VYFPAVHRDGSPPKVGALRIGILAGVLAASALFGAFVIYGVHDQAAVFEPDLGPPVGAVMHLGVCLAWAMMFAVVAAPWRGLRVLAVAFVVSAIAGVVSAFLLPAALRLGNDLYASMPRAMVSHTLMALAFATGMRLARG
jgi:hypothetical protein